MSISIGIGIETDNEIFFRKLSETARSFSYEISSGVAKFEHEIHEGVETLRTLKGWKNVYCLKAPTDAKANLAFGVYKELIKFQTSGEKPAFFDFCKVIAQDAKMQGFERIGIFFATEWHAKDRIRMSYGNVSRLLTILSLPGHWTVNTLNPQTGRMEEWDELPFFFELDC